MITHEFLEKIGIKVGKLLKDWQPKIDEAYVKREKDDLTLTLKIKITSKESAAFKLKFPVENIDDTATLEPQEELALDKGE